MLDTLQFFLLAFIVGLTGALAPGPTLVATINASMASGWTVGPRITFGHMLSELIIVILIVAGLATVALRYTTAVAVIGGVALILFGILTLTGSREVSLAGSKSPESVVTTSPFFAGFVTSVANPVLLDLVADGRGCDGDRRALPGGSSLPASSWPGTGVRISGGTRWFLPVSRRERPSSPISRTSGS